MINFIKINNKLIINIKLIESVDYDNNLTYIYFTCK